MGWLDATTNTPPDGSEIIIKGAMFELTAFVKNGCVCHLDTGLPIIFRIVAWRYK